MRPSRARRPSEPKSRMVGRIRTPAHQKRSGRLLAVLICLSRLSQDAVMRPSSRRLSFQGISLQGRDSGGDRVAVGREAQQIGVARHSGGGPLNGMSPGGKIAAGQDRYLPAQHVVEH
jgi:hypothetical protein